ncbi:MAG: Hpt domain-containing protein [Bacteroidia bacterium]|nr:Hpt domain-containing protein [Bacteroidia bacterium]
MGQSNFTFHPSLDSEYLKKFYEDDWEYAYDMFETYRESASNAISGMKKAISEKDQENLGRHIHKLRPAFMMVGLRKLYELSDEVEEKGAENFVFGDLVEAATEIMRKMEESNSIIIEEISRLRAVTI